MSFNVFAYQMYIDYLEKTNDFLIPSTLLDPKMSKTKRVEYDVSGLYHKLDLS